MIFGEFEHSFHIKIRIIGEGDGFFASMCNTHVAIKVNYLLVCTS